MVVLFHLLMLAIDAAVLQLLGRRPRGRVFLGSLAGAGLAAALAAAVVAPLSSDSRFALLGLAALAVFVHGPILLVGGAWLLRRPRPVVSKLAVTAAAALGLVAVDAYWIEPRWLQVSRLELRSPKLERPLRLAVVADLQADAFGAHERRALAAAMAVRPDVILLPGDYLQIGDPERRARVRDELRRHLLEIDFGAPLGAYAIRGDMEWGDDRWASLFDGTRVTAVETEGSATTLELPALTLTALSPAASRRRSLRIPPSERLHVVMGHAPDFALSGVEADLLIAGHTHGGQVRLPFLGPVVTFSAVPRRWAAGLTDLGGGRTLVVSRGVGLERGSAPRIRFLCRPEIVVIDLVPEDRLGGGEKTCARASRPS